MRILAIDPGEKQSAYVVLEHKTMKVEDRGILPNTEFIMGFRGDTETFFNNYYDAVVIEYPAPRGQPMYTQLVDTIFWIGRFAQACSTEMIRMDRKDVKMALCDSTKAKDSNIRAACISRFEYQVKHKKGRCPVIGAGGCEGPLYGIVKDIWAALAVALTFMDSLGKESHLDYGKKPPRRRIPRSYSKEFDKVLK